MGAMLAVTLAIKAAIYILDELYVSFEEQQEIVDNLTTEIEESKNEYDTLKEDPSTSGKKLEDLKKELEYKKDLLAVEKEKLALKDIDTMSSDGVATANAINLDTNLNNLSYAREKLSELGDNGNDNLKRIYTEQEETALNNLKEQVNAAKEEYLSTSEEIERLQQYIADGTLTGVNADNARNLIVEKQAELVSKFTRFSN